MGCMFEFCGPKAAPDPGVADTEKNFGKPWGNKLVPVQTTVALWQNDGKYVLIKFMGDGDVIARFSRLRKS